MAIIAIMYFTVWPRQDLSVRQRCDAHLLAQLDP